MSVISSEITIVLPGVNAQSLTPGFDFQDGYIRPLSLFFIMHIRKICTSAIFAQMF